MNRKMTGVVLSVAMGVVALGSRAMLAETIPAPAAAVSSPAPVAAVQAQSPAPTPERQHGNWFASKLNLTPDQQDKMSHLRQDMKAKMKPIFEQMKTKQGELKALWEADTPDRNAIVAKTDEVSVLRKSMQDAQIDFRLATKAVFTPAQLAQLKEMRAARKSDGEAWGRRGRRGCRRGGRRGGRGRAEGFDGGNGF